MKIGDNKVNAILKQFRAILKENQIKINEPIKNYTTFKIGGPAKVLVVAEKIDEISKIINVCKKENVKYYILGRGSNLLAKDEGYDGVLILINISKIEIANNIITVEAGAKLSRIAQIASENNLSGFEFAHGIPGSIGGAVVMNAGAYGDEIKDVLLSIEAINAQGKQVTLQSSELNLGYRTSIIPKEGLIVLSATIKLNPGNREDIEKKTRELNQQRRDKQPLNYPSAGSTFKRPEGYFAGKLISDAGLAGLRIGDAQVSEKHCGFIVNVGSATYQDVNSLIEKVKYEVFRQFGVMLESEVKVIE
ncbi:MAG: UDP-N-acetylenolpyruvoylglucosamine reductase [Candidatus Epulonipiscioides saccharophilum]|nr:MAG: UDP-N-acetylenolpyruvoylglucosamine reductase [Epulopiscium sp. AS2M-Bin001]